MNITWLEIGFDTYYYLTELNYLGENLEILTSNKKFHHVS